MTVSLTSVSDVKLHMCYISPQDTDLIAPTNVVPYCEYARYITSVGAVPASVGKSGIASNSIQLSSIPNKFYVVVRKRMSNMTVKDSNSFLPIKKVAIQFNNVASILSSASQHDLYKLSRKNGSKQSVYEFYGRASGADYVSKPTCGSIVILDPVDFGLPEIVAPGSTGSFNFQITVDVDNTDTVEEDCELLVVMEQSGVFITENGASSVQTALFTRKLVADATTEQFGESRDFIQKFTDDMTLVNVPLQNYTKSGSGVRSGGSMAKTAGDYSREALARIHGSMSHYQ
jgi:hypothetical protein